MTRRDVCEAFQPDRCNQCGRPGAVHNRQVDEYLCEECLPFAIEQAERDNERAWERQCESFYGGGFESLLEQQIKAKRLK